MKKMSGALCLLWVSIAIYGQTLAEWSFENVSTAIASTPISASYTAASCRDAKAYLYGGNNVGTPSVCSGINAWATNFWPTTNTYSDGDCLEFTLTASTMDLMISDFSFSASLSSGSGPQQYAISYYTSTGDFGLLTYGGFAAGACSPNGAACGILLPRGASLAIRIHPFEQDPGAMAATLRVDNVQISGAQFLPIQLLSFDVRETADHHILLQWQTAMESNVQCMVIERSGDAKIFHEVGKVAGQGDSFEPRAYQFKDLDPLQGCNYYRLKTIDRDSSISWSDIRVLCIQNESPFYAKVYPNPASDKIYLILPVDLDQAQLSLIDTWGKKWPIQRHGNQLNISQIPAGIYLLGWKDKKKAGVVRFKKI